MTLAAKLGMDPKVFAGIVNTSSGRCWSSDTYNPYPGVLENVPASRGYAGGFGADLMLKDLSLVTEAARTAKVPVLMGAHRAAGLPEALGRRARRQGFLQRHPPVPEDGRRTPRTMITHRIEGHTAIVTIDNPPANTWTPEDLRALENARGRAERRPLRVRRRHHRRGREVLLRRRGPQEVRRRQGLRPPLHRLLRLRLRGAHERALRHHRGDQRLRHGRRPRVLPRLRPAHRRGARADGAAGARRGAAARRLRHAEPARASWAKAGPSA